MAPAQLQSQAKAAQRKRPAGDDAHLDDVQTKVQRAAGSASPSLPHPPASPNAAAARDLAASSEKAPTLSVTKSWEAFSNDDPLYALLGELSEKKIFDSSGSYDEEVLEGYITRLVQPGVVRKLKQWVEIWAQMNIPVEFEMQSIVVQAIVRLGLECEVADSIPEILAELVKGHRAKLTSVEDALKVLYECGDDEQGYLVRFFVLIFPKSPTSEWGWSRVGWNWQQWWSVLDRILAVLSCTGAYDMLCALLRKMEADSGSYLPHQQMWDEKRLALVREALCGYGGMAEDELKDAFDVCLE
jgi:hypothetical protein